MARQGLLLYNINLYLPAFGQRSRTLHALHGAGEGAFMGLLVGIRKEDKNHWERRVPLVPEDVSGLQASGLKFVVQSSATRIFTDDEYRFHGIAIGEDLSPASIILAVKEIPPQLLEANKIYVFFAHVTKGQSHNMPMLRRLMELGCSLIDYEKIRDEEDRRLIFFGRHAGYAGMLETLRCLGLRLACEGILTPLAQILPAYQYDDLAAAKDHLRRLRPILHSQNMPCLRIGFSGHGNVSSGAQEVLDCLAPVELQPAELMSAGMAEEFRLVKTVFREEHMVRPKEPGREFDLLDYYRHPERYETCFEPYLACLDALVNCIYWEPRYPRLVTRAWVRRGYRAGSKPRLKVIGDISCDVEGSVEVTLEVTQPDAPYYVYLPDEDAVRTGVEGDGPVIMAVDNLPCEISRESSCYFSSVLRDMVGALCSADWEAPFGSLRLPSCLKRAVIVHRGELTPEYAYLHGPLGTRGGLGNF
jgi:saccharopine dehydrogenase (NAD+, L-lysine forming)